MSHDNSDNDDIFLPKIDQLQILSHDEYDQLWSFPKFSQEDRELFFTLTPREEHAINAFRTDRTKLHLLLQPGYFRARQRFFLLHKEFVEADIEYLRRRYRIETDIPNQRVSNHTRQRHIDNTFWLFGFLAFWLFGFLAFWLFGFLAINSVTPSSGLHYRIGR